MSGRSRETDRFLLSPWSRFLPEWVPRAQLVQAKGRIVSAETGFSVTFPEHWVWLPPSDEVLEMLWAGVEEVQASMPDPAAAQQLEVARAGFVELALIAFGPSLATEHHESCMVFARKRSSGDRVYSASDAIALAVAAELVASHGDDQLSVTYLTVSAGEAARIDYTDVDESTGESDQNSHFILTDGRRRFDFLCSALVAPPERWRSIAESFEFLPEPV